MCITAHSLPRLRVLIRIIFYSFGVPHKNPFAFFLPASLFFSLCIPPESKSPSILIFTRKACGHNQSLRVAHDKHVSCFIVFTQVVTIQRFNALTHEKSMVHVNITPKIQLPVTSVAGDVQTSVEYNLYAIVLHVGPTRSRGHYVLLCRFEIPVTIITRN